MLSSRSTAVRFVLVAVFLLRSHPATAQCRLHEQVKLVAADAGAGDGFGARVSMSDSTIVVGAPYNDHAGGIDAGAAYVFVRSGVGWIQQVKLIALDAAQGDEFGNRVSIDGDTVIVAAPRDDHAGGTNAGSVYIFVRAAGVWSQQAKITADDAAADDEFGYSVSIFGDTALVGAYADDHAGGVNAGSAYVFVRSGTTWTQQAKLTANDAASGDEFGWSASISADTALVGAPSADHAGGNNAGAAYVFVRSGTNWVQQAKLTPADAASSDSFGYMVAIDGNAALIGAINNDHDGASDAGAAYTFLRVGGIWIQRRKLVTSDAATDDLFGHWGSVSGNAAAAGAPQDDHLGGNNAGSAYVFGRPLDGSGDMTETVKLIASDAATDDKLGVSITINGTTAVVGAPLDDHTGGIDAGSAYVFDLGPDCNGNSIPDECDMTFPIWNLRASTGPSPRQLHALAYDSARHRTVLFGGNDTSNLGDTWEWNGNAWMSAHQPDLSGVAAPKPRSLFAMAYDSMRGRTVLFGGYDPSFFGDTWEWDGTDWTLVHLPDPTGVTAPTPRRGAAMAYDSARGVMVLFGGSDGGLGSEVLKNDTWTWNGTVWTCKCGPSAGKVCGPSPRGGHAMAYDSVRDRIVLFGGVSTTAACGVPPRCDDTWEWDGANGTWTQQFVSGPGERNEHAMAYDSADGVTVLFGGHEETSNYGDTWEWNGTTWTPQPNAVSRHVQAPAWPTTLPATRLCCSEDWTRAIWVIRGSTASTVRIATSTESPTNVTSPSAQASTASRMAFLMNANCRPSAPPVPTATPMAYRTPAILIAPITACRTTASVWPPSLRDRRRVSLPRTATSRSRPETAAFARPFG